MALSKSNVARVKAKPQSPTQNMVKPDSWNYPTLFMVWQLTALAICQRRGEQPVIARWSKRWESLPRHKWWSFEHILSPSLEASRCVTVLQLRLEKQRWSTNARLALCSTSAVPAQFQTQWSHETINHYRKTRSGKAAQEMLPATKHFTLPTTVEIETSVDNICWARVRHGVWLYI